MSPPCIINGCYCDEVCHTQKDCCSDIDDIGCHPGTSSSSIVSPTPTDNLIRQNQKLMLLLNVGNFYEYQGFLTSYLVLIACHKMSFFCTYIVKTMLYQSMYIP